MTRVVVLGAGGWLGRAILRALLAQEAGTGLGRSQLEGKTAAQLRTLLEPDGHLVVVNAVGRLRGSEDELIEPNVEFPGRLVRALDGTGAHLVHLGSAAEYGDHGEEPISERAVLRPRTPYGRFKAEASMKVLDRTEWCVLRPFNVVDASMVPENPVAVIRDAIRSARSIELPAQHARRDHVSRTFVASSVVAAARSRVEGAFNLCSGVALDYGTIAMAIGARLGKQPALVDLHRPGIPVVVGDPSVWAGTSGLSEAMDAEAVADLVCGWAIG